MAGKEGKKGRKIGRNKKKPCQLRYVAERRDVKNKEKKILKYLKKHGGTVRAKLRETIYLFSMDDNRNLKRLNLT